MTSPPRSRRARKPQVRQRAMWYIARGYPAALTAKIVGTTKKSVLKWARKRGIKPRLLSVLRMAEKLSSADQLTLVAKLQQTVSP